MVGRTHNALPKSSATMKIMCGVFSGADGTVRKELAPVSVNNNKTATDHRRLLSSISILCRCTCVLIIDPGREKTYNYLGSAQG